MPARRALGLAAHYSFVSYVAVVAEVEIDEAMSEGIFLRSRRHQLAVG